jgi:hypothetical protein
MCGDTLVVLTGALLSGGAPTPPSYRAPIVVLLDRAPSDVNVRWELAS